MPTGKLRAALLASAALTALCLPPAQPARAGPDWCTSDLNTSTAICSGDQSAGILEYNRYFLTVRNLSGDIEPAAGDVGVLLLNIPPGAITTEPGLYSIITTGDGAYGIYAKVVLHSIRVTNNLRITTAGARSDAIKATVFVGDGPAEVINSADLTTTGEDSRGIFVEMGPNGLSPVENTNANVVNHGAITTGGARSHAIVASALVGDATITNDARITVTGDDAYGFFAIAGGDVAQVVNGGPIMMTGQANRAIVARGSNSGDVQNDGPLSLDEANSYGIDAQVAGPVLVTSTADITATGSGSFGITAFSISQGKATIVSSGDISTSGGASRGLWASAANGDAYVRNDGIIRNTGPGESLGIGAFASIGLVTVKNYGAVTTEGGHAIMATNFVGDIDITNDASLTAGRNGIYAAVFDDGDITINSDSTRAGSTGGIIADIAGIQASTATGDVSVVSVGDVTAGNRGIDVYARNGGNLSVKSYGTILSNDGSAIVAIAAGPGSVTIHSTGDLTARQDGINGITRNGDATIVNAGSITMVGDYARAIHLEAYGSQGVATLTSAGRLSAVGLYSLGIAAEVHDGVALNVDNRGDVDVVGIGAYGMSLRSESGNIDLTSRGAITAEGGFNYGIAVGSAGADAAVVSEGDIRILGQYGRGIVVNGVNARADSSGNLGLDGNGAVGILASADVQSAASDPGMARITSAGIVTMTGADAVALRAQSLFGDAEIIIADGTVTGGSGQGGAGVELSAARAARLENRGTIRSLNSRAIVNDPGSGPATIDNLNTIIGSISLDDGTDSLVNRGWFEARGDSDFGSGIDAMVNSGTLHVSDSGGADQVTILGLESFTNGTTGLIALVDGRTGDRLTLRALTAFNGGGAIALDAALAGTGFALFNANWNLIEQAFARRSPDRVRRGHRHDAGRGEQCRALARSPRYRRYLRHRPG
jgi:hypothetical protein